MKANPFPSEQITIEENIEILSNNIELSIEEIDWLLKAQEFGFKPSIALEWMNPGEVKVDFTLERTWTDGEKTEMVLPKYLFEKEEA